MIVLIVGGAGIDKSMTEGAMTRKWSNRITVLSNIRADVEESKVSLSIANLKLHGQYSPCKLPSGYKTEKN
jgi:hypothetical protein